MWMNALLLVAITLAYGVLFLLLPYRLYGMPARPQKWLAKLFMTLCASTAQMVLLVYLLSFLRILTFWTLLLASAAAYAGVYLVTRRLTPLAVGERAFQFIMRVHGGYYKPRVMLLKAWRGALGGAYRWYRTVVRPQPLWAALVALCFAYGIAIRAWPVIAQTSYGVTDLYTYTQWIKALLNGNIFQTGVYFYGLHNTVAAMTLLLHVNVVTILRLLGVSFAIMTMAAVFWVMRTVFENKWAALVALVVYGCVQTFTDNTYFRHSYAIAQEFSQMFWVICCGFFVPYLEEGRRFDLAGYAIALLCVVLVHYYGLMVTALFCVAYFLVYIKRALANRARMVRELVVAVGGALVIGLLPLAVGLLMGKGLDASFLWGMQVVQSGGAGWAPTVAAGQDLSYFERVLHGFDQLELPMWFYAQRFIPLALALALSAALAVMRRTRRAGMRLLGICCAQGLLGVMMIAGPLGLPALLDQWRAPMFFTVLGGALYAVPVEFFALLTYRARKSITAVFAVACTAALFVLYGPKYVAERPAPAQLEGAMRAYYQIIADYPIGTWTIVSPVEESSLTQNEGYHYELFDFIIDMENLGEDTEIIIPTRTIFFFLEKIPLNYELIEDKLAQVPYPMNPDDAGKAFTLGEGERWITATSAYNLYPNRHILQAKLYRWLEAYMGYFPDDFTICYEDEELVVYRFTQNMYAQSNLAIDYGYNAPSGGGEVRP